MPRREREPIGYRDGVPETLGHGFYEAWQRGDVTAGIGAEFAFVELDDAPSMVRNAAYAFGIDLPADRSFDRTLHGSVANGYLTSNDPRNRANSTMARELFKLKT